ncbi:hypothetical protein FRB97_004900 [Tulasnella sp. 331]|nr:hypothetical protein FRB97_004900 [Tulasnella sp. 331]
MDENIVSPTEIYLSDNSTTTNAASTRSSNTRPGRGRKRDDSLPYNRARDIQRRFRARREAHLEELEERNMLLELENEQLRTALEMEPSSRPLIGTGPTGRGKPRIHNASSRKPAKERSDASEADLESADGSPPSTPANSPPHLTIVAPISSSSGNDAAASRLVAPCLSSHGEPQPLQTEESSRDYPASTAYFHSQSEPCRSKSEHFLPSAPPWAARRHTLASTAAPLIMPRRIGWDCDSFEQPDVVGSPVESPLEAGLRLETTRRPRTSAFVEASHYNHHDHIIQAAQRYPYAQPAPHSNSRTHPASASFAHWNSDQQNPQIGSRQRSYSVQEERYEPPADDFGSMNSHGVSGMPISMHGQESSPPQLRPISYTVSVAQYTQQMEPQTYDDLQHGQQHF